MAVASHSVCQWMLCESSRSCIWENQTKRLDSALKVMIQKSQDSIFSVCVLKCKMCKIEMYTSVSTNFSTFLNLARATSCQWLGLGYLLIHSIYTQSPILAWLFLALVNVDFALVSLETGQAGASEATGVVMATAAIETALWLTLINLDLASGPCEHQSSTDVKGPVMLLHRLRAEGENE